MEIIKKIKQNGILFVGVGLGISGLIELIGITEPIKSVLHLVGFILTALPFPFYIYDGIRALKKETKAK
ncbi:MAG: hypothetical protein P8O90_08740 [Flavobacteriaceae bacterium]|nr:hypothetical protein [Flavobacteriaceae bacterium]